MKLVSWQSALTEHQVHLMRALYGLIGSDLLVVGGVQYLTERQVQGWVDVDTAGIDFIVLPSTTWWQVASSLIQQNRQAVHIFGGVFTDRRFLCLMLYCKLRGIKFALMSEPYAEEAVGYFDDEPWILSKIKTYLRATAYRVAGYMIGRNLLALFPISNFATLQFERNGFKARGTYPFAYFVPQLKLAVQNHASPNCQKTVRIVFVGSFIKRKGVNVLISAWREAQARLVDSKVRLILDIYGPGQPSKCNLPENANFMGCIPFGDAQFTIAQYDALVLPSIYDGWGVVVNEALLQGVPALVSDRVGSKVLVHSGDAGLIFKAGSVPDLTAVFLSLADNPLQLEGWRRGARRVADTITPAGAAKYLLACLEHAESIINDAPSPPWMTL